MQVFSFKNIRILFLLSILALAAIYTKQQSLSTLYWYKPIEVTIFPINGDGSTATDQYIKQLSEKNFQDIDRFFIAGSKQYNLTVQQPFQTRLGDTVESHPPVPPKNRNSMLQVIIWSMKLRYWAYQNTPDNKPNKNRIRLYVMYHQPNGNKALQHSLGLQKGLLGIIHAYADPQQNKQNSIVMAHEILHTVGASDKYDHTNYPIHPDGFAQPDKQPLYPQKRAEIMAGRTPVSEYEAEMPNSLSKVLVGEATAKEINWIQRP